MKRVIFILLLVFLGGISQAQDVKDIKWKYTNGKGDGYDISVTSSYVLEVSYPEQVCLGNMALITVKMGGGSLFAYRWYEDSDADATLSESAYLFIENCTLAENGKMYWCEITDLSSGEIIELDEPVILNVVKNPSVAIKPSMDTTLCYGETIRLTSNLIGDEYYYSWEGAGVVSSNAGSYQVDVKPEVSTQYKLVVSDGMCSGSATVNVNVRHPKVKLPEDIVYVGSSGMLELTPVSDSKTGKFNWQVGSQTINNQPVLTTPVTGVATAIVTLQEGRCKAVDSCVVIPELSFGRFIGGEQDGFTESRAKVTVSGITPVENHICLGNSAYFFCNVDLTSTFNFQWYKVSETGADVPLTGATEQLLEIEANSGDVAGEYYCMVTDQDSKESVKTDAVKLFIYNLPEINIIQPTTHTAICQGDKITLKADRTAGEGESLLWSGYNILTNPTLSEITVAPTDTTVYELMLARMSENGDKIVCRTTQELRIDVRSVDLHLDKMRDVLLGEATTFEPEVTPGAVYTWTVEGSKTIGNSFTYTPNQNTTVFLNKKLGNCVVKDSCQIFIKEYGVGSSEGQDEDGYSESVLPFRIKLVECPEVVCEGSPVLMNIEVYGYDVYEYTWKKRISATKTVVIDSVALHKIESAGLEDAGTYFCEVKEVRSGQVLISEDVSLKVLPIPDAEIQSPANGKWICKGASIDLKAYSSGSGVTYLWEGIDIIGDKNALTTTVAPTESVTYSLIVDNGTCSSVAYVQINVQNISVDIPEVVYTNAGNMVNIKPLSEIAPSAQLTWSWNGQEVQGTEFSKLIPESTVVHVRMEQDGCEATDSSRIYVRNVSAFRNGQEDGFIESNINFRILEFSRPSVVCENADANFSLRLRGSGIYSYAWREEGNNSILSDESTYKLSSCQLSDAGRKFYCTVTDLMVGTTLSTDTMTLAVRKGPKAIISYPERGKRYCVGTEIKLDARETENSKESENVSFLYSWEGENVTETENEWTVLVRPQETQTYTLKVTVDGCVDYDTITIFVLNPKVEVPSVVYAAEGEMLSVSAKVADVSTAATINWWHDALFVPDRNPYMVKINQSAILVAEVEEQGCVSTDTTRVYVRNAKYYNGGEDDGFMESCDIPVIDANIDNVLGCGGADSVSLVVSFTGSPKEIHWQKEDEDGSYVDITAPGDGHIQGLGTSILTIDPLTAADYGKYRCVLKNDCGDAHALYTVANGDVPQLLTKVLDTVEFCEGVKNQEIVIPVDVEASVSEISYRWYKKNVITNVVQQFTPVESYNNVSFVFPEVAVQHDALYYVEAENACGVTKDSIRVLVTRKVALERQPNDTLVCVNTPVSVSVRAKDGGVRAYSLKKVIPDQSVFVGYKVEKVLAGNGSNTYKFPSITRDDEGYYVWTVKASCGDSISTNMFKITVDNPLQFTYQTPDTTLCYGTTLELQATAESPDCPDSKITYSWEKVGEGLLTYINSTVSFPFTEGKEGQYICRARNVCSQISLDQPIEIKAHPALAITKVPVWESAGICEDKAVTLDFAVNFPSVVDSIRWFRKVNANYYPVYNEDPRIAGADGYKLMIDSILLHEGGEYRARAYNVCGVFETTIGASIKVDTAAKIIKGIADFFPDNTVCQGEEADLKVEAIGKQTLFFSWLVNDNLIPNATSDTYHVVFDSAAIYECRVHNYCATDNSTHKIEVIKSDTFRLQPVGYPHYCEGGAGIPLQLVGSDTNYVYKLYKKATADATPQMIMQQTGKDAAFLGGSLNFGTQPAGIYYVQAFNNKTLCEATMPGVVTIVKDTLPPAFDAFIMDPICEGEAVGVIALDSSVYTTTQIFKYTLKQLKQDGSGWNTFGLQQAGSGDTLVWADVIPGIYRIEAMNYETKCSTWMNNELDLQSRPLPKMCTLEFVKGDSVYCSEDKIDVALGMKSECVVNGMDYTLRKDGVLLSEETLNQLPVAWDTLTPGKYSVEIKNEWGCTVESNEINIRVLPVPAKKTLKGNRYYCVADVVDGESTAITLINADPEIKYEFFREGEETSFDAQYKDLYPSLVTDVALKDGVYYVVATDTATGCSTRMTNTVFVKGSRLSLSHDPIVMDKADTEVRLNLIVKDTIGSPKILWEPAGQIIDVTDPKRPWMDMSDLSKNKFTVTVSDSACTKSLPVMVTFSGEDLTASIKDPLDCSTDIPQDTLRLCAGANFSLCGNITGGNGIYGYEWKQNGSILGSATSLVNVSVDTSGYLVFRVGSGGRIAKDSIWLEVHPRPGKGLEMPAEEMCAAPGQNIDVNLHNTRENVSYALEYSKTGEVYKDCEISAVADASGVLTLSRPYTDENAGYYRIKATYAYDDMTCSSLHYGVNVRRGTYKGQVSGGGTYCERPDLDTIVLDTAEKVASYRLIYKAEGSHKFVPYAAMDAVKGNGKALVFTGNFPDGTYRIVAERPEGACVDTMYGEVVIHHLFKPNPGELYSDPMEYCLQDGTPVTAQISIRGCEKGNSYKLYCKTSSGVDQMGKTVIGQEGEVAFGLSFDKPGRYFSVADNGSCRDTAGYVLIGKLPEDDILLSKVDTGYCAGDDNSMVHLKIYPVETGLNYYIYSEYSYSSSAKFETFDKDTAYYAGRLPEGKYIVKAEVADCEKVITAPITIKEYPLPAKVDLMKPTASCEGKAIAMGVMGGKAGVLYELYRESDTGVDVCEAQGWGDGNDLKLADISDGGVFYIQAQDTLTNCVRKLTGYEILPAPKQFKFWAVDTFYCAYYEDSGSQLALSGTEFGVNYILQVYDTVTKDFVDVMPEVSITGMGVEVNTYFSGIYPAGKYRVRTNTCGGGLIGDVLELKEVALPSVDLAVNIGGKACIDSTMQVILVNAEKDVEYTLWKGGSQLANTITGNGANASWTLSDVVGGEYEIHAVRKGNNQTSCAVTLDKHVKVSSLPFIDELSGSSDICEFATTNLKLMDVETGVKYWLMRQSDGDTVCMGNVSQTNVQFNKVKPGAYYAIAENGDCRNYSPVFTIDAVPAPDITDVVVSYAECVLPGKGAINIPVMSDTLAYYLTYPNGNEEKQSSVIDGVSYTFENLEFGAYYFRVQDQKTLCFSESDTLRLKNAVPVADTLIGNFGYCKGELGARLSLGASTANVRYTITNAATGEVVESIFGGIGKSFLKNYPAGEYVFTATREGNFGGCKQEKTFSIKQYEYPATDLSVEIAETAPWCAGQDYHITVKNAEEDVAYILKRDELSIDTITGAGDITFAAVTEAGYYTILPKGGATCGKKALDTTIVINKLPKAVYVEQPCSYCNPAGATDEVGAELHLYDGVEGIRYILTDGSQKLDTVWGNYDVMYVAFKNLPAAEYYVLAEDTLTGCSAYVDTAEITKGVAPVLFTCGEDGSRCGDAIEVATSDGCETGVEYYLYKDGVKIDGPVVKTAVENVSFGVQTEAGIYKIYGQYVNGCGTFMKDSISIHGPVKQDTISVKGSYCEGGDSDIALRVRETVPEWMYYIEKDGKYTDTLNGYADGTPLRWTRLDGKDLRAGIYRLYAMNNCGDTQLLDTVVIDTNHLPQKFAIKEGDYTLCNESEGTITLENSSDKVSYQLTYNDGILPEKLLATKDGVNGELMMAKITEAGIYTVIGSMKASGCSDTIDMVTVKVIDGVPDPGVVANDVCQDAAGSKTLTVSLNNKELNDINYYLKRMSITDTVMVDSIKMNKVSDLLRTAFEAQTEVGVYQVVAVGPTCSRTFPAARIGKEATVQDLNPVGVLSVCNGGTIDLKLDATEKGVNYELYKIVIDAPDSTVESTNVIVEGTGEALKIASVSAAGRYIVKAKNGCTVDMNGEMQVQVNVPPAITLRKDGYTICAVDDSVQIEILGRTNQNENALYLVYPPTVQTIEGHVDEFVEAIPAGAGAASVKSVKWYKEPGYYKIMQSDATNCPTIDSVKIEVLPLPEVFDFHVKGNPYICGTDAKKQLVLEGAQAGVDYHLYRKEGDELVSVTMVASDKNQDQLIFEATVEGVYVVKAAYNDKAKGCPQLMNGEVTLTAAPIQQYKLEALIDAYCERPDVNEKGKVKLLNSSTGVSYQLYKDGAIYGDPKTVAVAGMTIVWDNLPGGIPKMSFSQAASPVIYKVVATDLATSCQTDMLGNVEIYGERSIQFNDAHLANDMPKCIGEPLQMEITAYGGKISYSWYKNGVQIPDADKYLYSKESITEGDLGNYYCVMTNTCGKDSTRKVNVVPSLLVEKANEGIDTVTLCDLQKDEVRTQQLVSSVLNASKWEWYKDGVLLASENNKWVDVNVSLHNGSGMYTCKAFNDCGALWDTCVIMIDSTPRIDLVNQVAMKDTLCYGSSYTLAVTSNYPVSWYRGSTELGITGTTLNLAAIKQDDAGVYNAVAKNGCGSKEVTVGSLVVDDTVKLISENDLFRVCRQKGDIPELFIQTSPSERVTYRWEDQSGAVLGTTNRLINIDLSKYNQHKEIFRVYYQNKCNTGYKDIKMLISDAIHFEQPVNEIQACVSDGPQSTVLKVKVDETSGITYKWYYSQRGGDNVERDSVGNADTLLINMSSTKAAGFYYCYLANMCVDTTSHLVSVRVDTTPVIQGVLEKVKKMCAGDELALKIKGNGGSLTYNWYVKKKNKTPEKLLSETFFGASESAFKCKVDSSFNESLVWCDVTNSCKKVTTDTMHLTIWPAPQVEMTPAYAESCEGAEAEIYITLKSGEKPWKYKYSVDGVEESDIHSVDKDKDTLKISTGGKYRIYWLNDQKCTTQGKELAISEYKTYKVSEVSMEAVNYIGAVCPGDTVTLKVTISGSVPGPWNVEIRRKSDGELASELGFDGPVYTTEPEYSCKLKVTKNEEYFARVTNVFLGGMECEAKSLTSPVKIEMKAKPEITMNALTPEERIISRCQTVDLSSLFNVGYPADKGGYYTVDGLEVAGDWILKMKDDQNKYKIGYRIYDEGCKYDYSLGELEAKPRPEVSIEKSEDVLCSSIQSSTVTISAKGEYPLKVTYRIINLRRNGTAQLQTTVPGYEFKDESSVLKINVSYDEDLVGKVFEITRVEDKYKCIVEDLTDMKDTVHMSQRPTFKLYSKVGGTLEWKTSSQQNYTIRRGDSVDVKISMAESATLPWTARFYEVFSANGVLLTGIQETDKDTVLKDPGLYEVAVQDKYCPCPADYNPSIYVKVIDTAYLNVKAYLQGPWNGTRMSSNVLSKISKRGLSAWPNVGSKAIIDWVEVELWTEDSVFWDSQACLLLEDGTIVDKTGSSQLKMIGRGNAKYHVAVRPRNHLAVLSKAMDLSGATAAHPVLVDFTKSSSIQVNDGGDINTYVYINDESVVFLYGGDVNTNRLISAYDPNKIARDLLSIDKLESEGAVLFDINYNSKVEWPGFNVDPTTGAASQDDWAIMFRNRLKYTLVPERIIDWEH